MLLVKQVINCIAKPIMYIYNLSFTTGEFTEYNENSKSTHTLSLGGDKYTCTNYIHISVLPQFSKILQRNVHFSPRGL